MSFSKAQRLIGKIMLIAILMATGITLCGLVLYLTQHPNDTINFSQFPSEIKQYTSISEIFLGAMHHDAQSIMMLGLLFVIGGQILRVILTGYVFVMERDTWFILFTLIILGALMNGWF